MDDHPEVCLPDKSKDAVLRVDKPRVLGSDASYKVQSHRCFGLGHTANTCSSRPRDDNIPNVQLQRFRKHEKDFSSNQSNKQDHNRFTRKRFGQVHYVDHPMVMKVIQLNQTMLLRLQIQLMKLIPLVPSWRMLIKLVVSTH